MIFLQLQWVPQRNQISKLHSKRIHLLELTHSGESTWQTSKVDIVLYKNNSSNYNSSSNYSNCKINHITRNSNNNKVIVFTYNIHITSKTQVNKEVIWITIIKMGWLHHRDYQHNLTRILIFQLNKSMTLTILGEIYLIEIINQLILLQ